MDGLNHCEANFKDVIVIIQLNENHIIKHTNVINLRPASILPSSGVFNNVKVY